MQKGKFTRNRELCYLDGIFMLRKDDDGQAQSTCIIFKEVG